MSIIDSPLFSPLKAGSLSLKNRIMRSATRESLSEADGRPTRDLLNLIGNLVDGEIGLIVPGAAFTSENGRLWRKQTGLVNLSIAESWRPIISYAHQRHSAVVFQLAHGGFLSLEKIHFQKSLKNIISYVKSMSKNEVDDVIDSFAKAAKIAQHIGADGVQLHAAHGYLISQFLSPATNWRKDKYRARTRLLCEIVEAVRRETRPSFSVSLKLSPMFGFSRRAIVKLIKQLDKKVDFFEISAGFLNPLKTSRVQPTRFNVKGVAQRILNPWPFYEDYNIDDAAYIKKKCPNAIIASVGGWRNAKHMARCIKKGKADIISLSRPLIREPYFIKDVKEGKKVQSKCLSCGSCMFDSKNVRLGTHCSFP